MIDVAGKSSRRARPWRRLALLLAVALSGCAHADGACGRWGGPAQEAALSVALGTLVGASVALIEAGGGEEPSEPLLFQPED